MAQHSHDQGPKVVAQSCSGLCAIDDGCEHTQEEGSHQEQPEAEDIVAETIIGGPSEGGRWRFVAGRGRLGTISSGPWLRRQWQRTTQETVKED